MSRYALTMAMVAAGVVVAAAGAASGTLDPGFGNAGVTISALVWLGSMRSGVAALERMSD